MSNLISIREFARRYRMSEVTLYRMLGRGDLEAVKVSGRTYILADEERRWRESLPKWKPKAALKRA